MVSEKLLAIHAKSINCLRFVITTIHRKDATTLGLCYELEPTLHRTWIIENNKNRRKSLRTRYRNEVKTNPDYNYSSETT